MIKRIVAIVVSSFVLVACGPGARLDGKQGAADALFAATRPTSAKGQNSASPADSLSIEYRCPEGGTANISAASFGIGEGGIDSTLNLGYSSCGLAKSDVGVAVYNGSLAFVQSIDLGNALSIDQQLKGRVQVQGAYDDFLDVNVTQHVGVGDLSGSGVGAVSMTLKGTITTSEGTFTYDEAVSVTPGQIHTRLAAQK